jgi:hypothetical protein
LKNIKHLIHKYDNYRTLGENQFDKMNAKGRADLLGAMHQTLADPVVVLQESIDKKDARLYIKSFREAGSSKKEMVMSVVVDIQGKAVAISTGQRRDSQIEKKIKTASTALYLKGEGGGGQTAWNRDGGPVAQDLEPSGSAPQDKSSPETGGKSSEFAKIQEKYRSAKAVEGDEDEIQAGKEALSGVWKLVEADTPAASHDESSFHKTPGSPSGKDGATINDRDYGHDKAAQEAVINIAADYDGRALKFDSPIVVTKDGIVISGNNRTMSSKLAARQGTDKKYIEALKKRAKKFGFTEEQVGQFKNPRVVFEVENNEGYSTDQFAKFNQSGKKEMGPTEKAVKVSKLIKPETVGAVAGKISEFDTLGELYADRGAVQHIFGYFKEAGLVGENEVAKYIEEGAITGDGKTFIETALLGSVMNESNIRGFNRPGCRSIRATLVRAITPLIENQGLEGYSINKELNEAVDIAMQVAVNKDKFKSVDDFSKQQSMFEKYDPVAVELAKKLEGTQKGFAEFMQKINGGLKYASDGQADIFLGGVQTKEDIVNNFFNIKKAVTEVLNSIRGFFD